MRDTKTSISFFLRIGNSLRMALLLCCWFFLCKDTLVAQMSGEIIENWQNKTFPFTINQFSTKQGLPRNQVIKVWPGNNGAMIVYTNNSVVEFNGYNFKSITTDKSFKNDYIKNLHYNKRQKTFLVLGDGKLFILSPAYKELHLNGINPAQFFYTHDSLLILSDRGSVYFHDPETNITKALFTSHNNFLSTKETTIEDALINGSKVYVTSTAGLFCINLQTKKITRLSEEHYNTMRLNPFNKRIYLTLRQSLFALKDERVEKVVDYVTAVPFHSIMDLVFTDSSTWFMATLNGMVHVKKNEVTHYNKSNGFPFGHIFSLCYDSVNHSLFVGTLEKGLLKLQFKSNYALYDSEGLPLGSTHSVIQTKNKKVFAATESHIYKLQNNILEKYTKRIENYSVITEINGSIYAGTWGRGIMVFQDGRLTDSLNVIYDRLPDNVIHGIFMDSKGTLWVGTGKGIGKGSGLRNIKPLLTDDIKDAIICFYELKNGNICVGGSKGVYIIEGNRIIARFDTADGFNGKEVRSFYEDAAGRLWIGSYGGGLYCYEKNKFVSVNAMKNCMLDNDVFCMAKDEYGYLFMTSNHGLWKVHEKELNDFYEKKRSFLIPYHYTEENGCLNTEFNGGFQNNYVKLENGSFIFPGIEGLTTAWPERHIHIPLQTQFSGIYVNDTLTTNGDSIFERSTHSVQFDFYCVNLNSKNNVYFQHKLLGETHYDWSAPQKQTSISLRMLPPGKYTFMVRAISAFNEQEPYVARYSFEILPHFYERTWFKALALAFLCLMAIFIMRLRVISQKKKVEQKEYYKRKVREVELTAIQAQLNPHFIFNCMNTIKYFILEKDFARANDGLNKLSKLIRNSLESSENMFMDLKREVTFISNYVELEKMRLQDQLTYAIHIDPEIDQQILIPHLLIQPYIENAIKHGIGNLETKKGVLNIDFTQTEENILCTITDNGIGREASGKLMTNTEIHLSKGTGLSQEKSLLLNLYYGYKCHIETTDLYDEANKSAGTEVRIEMSKTLHHTAPNIN